MDDLEKRLRSDYATALKAAQNIGSNKAAGGLEARASLAYQKLVRAGYAPQIRRKYRAQ